MLKWKLTRQGEIRLSRGHTGSKLSNRPRKPGLTKRPLFRQHKDLFWKPLETFYEIFPIPRPLSIFAFQIL